MDATVEVNGKRVSNTHRTLVQAFVIGGIVEVFGPFTAIRKRIVSNRYNQSLAVYST